MDWLRVLDQAADAGVRRTHALTLRNIVKALEYKVPLRVGIVRVLEGQRIAQAWRQLEALGVTRISLDHARPFGRAADGQQPNCSELCGRQSNFARAVIRTTEAALATRDANRTIRATPGIPSLLARPGTEIENHANNDRPRAP
ncbi:hypothetical protein [Streptomyces xiaopingdaonensis]|uniref:hypothetical protein n=1 Tax=Streptomyces xiaopingdaonensis TaxID=1565415 RepID=UPI001ED94951|nr:hypothetical protein [Streptomyces xiaopingdaonensis]